MLHDYKHNKHRREVAFIGKRLHRRRHLFLNIAHQEGIGKRLCFTTQRMPDNDSVHVSSPMAEYTKMRPKFIHSSNTPYKHCPTKLFHKNYPTKTFDAAPHLLLAHTR